MAVSPNDRAVLRRLGARIAEAAALPVQRRTADLWRRLNRLEPVRPLVWINEICWDEMGDELTLHCRDGFCRNVEQQLRRILYQWDHLPADMVVDGAVYCPLVVHDSGFGIEGKCVVPDHEFGARDYVPVIAGEADIERIRMPEVRVDREATERNRDRLEAIFDGILPVVVEGPRGFWFAPWDVLIQYWGIQELMLDMVDRPELVEQGIERMVRAHLSRLEQYEAQGALALNNNNVRVGSGGLGFSDELPGPDHDGARVRPIDLWGTATAQIFSEVSPAMHERFALRYERLWLERFGLNCYGCCEPLHRKMDMLASIPRLRRISFSPRADVEEAAAAAEDRYVYSHKPNPAILAAETWSVEAARDDLRSALDRTRGCRVEVIMKDVSTVRRQPERLWQWAAMARGLSEEYG